ncbi:MAG: hypothetical protein KAH84_06810 [Thiomargarita sp.]|nr:hypothetical protein [Thiomargarita sp.]
MLVKKNNFLPPKIRQVANVVSIETLFSADSNYRSFTFIESKINRD